ncbi:MAG TPA: response regulator transcription factor [Pyrinomonadaceae bacterium]|nr:response regulator transcription factor [Pyrinomonadaceae bacterium]
MTEKIKILIADDHPLIRQGLRQIIERESDLEIVFECGDGRSALDEILLRRPDVAILDIDMPHKTGLEVLRLLGESSFAGKAILLTVHNEEEFFDEAIQGGAKGYLLKDSVVQDIIVAIRAVIEGQNYVSPALTTMLFRQKRSPPAQSEPTGFETLTPTERTVLGLIAEYQTNNQIAETLFISPATVKTHRRNICAKLELEGNHSLMKFAVEYKSKV